MLAYSGVAQAGFMLAPLAVVGTNPAGALRAVVTYLLIYAAMNLGAFAVVLAVARKTRSAEIDTWGGLFEYAPGLSVLISLFLFRSEERRVGYRCVRTCISRWARYHKKK